MCKEVALCVEFKYFLKTGIINICATWPSVKKQLLIILVQTAETLTNAFISGD